MSRPVTVTLIKPVDSFFQNSTSNNSAPFGDFEYNAGNSCYVVADSSPGFNFGTGDFTVECYILTYDSGVLWDFRDGTGQNRLNLRQSNDNGTRYEIYIGETLILTSSGKRNGPGIAVVRKDGVISLYVRGILDNSVANTTDLTAGPFTVAADYNGANVGNYGVQFDEVRISNVARYDQSYPLAISSFVDDGDTQLLLAAQGPEYSEEVYDDARFTNTRNAVSTSLGGNSNISTAQSKFGGASLYFNNGFLTVSSYDQTWSDNELTIEGWVRFPKAVSDNPNGFVIWFTDNQGSYFAFNSVPLDGNSGGCSLNAMGARSRFDWYPNVINQWYHVALTRDSSDDFHLFVDGVEKAVGYGTGNASGTFIQDSDMLWGRWSDGSGYAAAEYYMDDIRLSSVNRYSSNFTSPTAALVNDYDTAYLLHTDGDNNSTVISDDTTAPPKTLSAPTSPNASNITGVSATLNWSEGV